MLDQPLGDNLGHDFVCIVDALAALKAQCESERVGKIARIRWRQPVGWIGHTPTITQGLERNKNNDQAATGPGIPIVRTNMRA